MESMTTRTPETGLDRLLSIMRQLRDPVRGCPWDIKQDFRSIAPHTIEEAYEVADAIEADDMDGLESELGDLLLQVVFLAQLAAEQELFDFAAVVERLNGKLIARHPHVFGEMRSIRTADEQKEFWEQSKQRERGTGSLPEELAAITKGLPAMLRALKIQQTVARRGYEFAGFGEALAKCAEELDEVAAARRGAGDDLEGEIGDVLFAAVNLARMCGVDPDQALRDTNAVFVERVKTADDLVKATGRHYGDLSRAEQDRVWEDAKSALLRKERDG